MKITQQLLDSFVAELVEHGINGPFDMVASINLKDELLVLDLTNIRLAVTPDASDDYVMIAQTGIIEDMQDEINLILVR